MKNIYDWGNKIDSKKSYMLTGDEILELLGFMNEVAVEIQELKDQITDLYKR